MHDHPTPTDRSAACAGPDALDQNERVVLDILLTSEPPGPWSLAELETALGSRIHAADATVALRSAGLIHQLGDFVFPTRAACRMHDLASAM
jgi:hypothetical protein